MGGGMTKAEREHLEKVAAMGCLVCSRPAEIHHIRTGLGMSQRASNYEVLPLCPYHHRQGGFGEAIHAGQKEFESKYGSEVELLNKINRRIGR
jgi:hypothetical protein